MSPAVQLAAFDRWVETGGHHHLPASREGDRDPHDALREQLAAAVEELNAEQDHDARLVLVREISALRDALGIRPGGISR